MLKTKMVISFLLAPRRSSLARTNALQLRATEKDIWSGKAQRSLRKKRFVNRPRSDTRRKSRRHIGRLRQFQWAGDGRRAAEQTWAYSLSPIGADHSVMPFIAFPVDPRPLAARAPRAATAPPACPKSRATLRGRGRY